MSQELQEINKALQTFSDSIRKILGEKATSEIMITGVNKIVLRGLAEQLVDDEGDKLDVKSFQTSPFGVHVQYLRPKITGDYYELSQISE